MDDPNRRKTLALDFDGVIHSYTSEWTAAETIPDPPVPGAFDFIRAMLPLYDITIFSVRAEKTAGVWAMYEWCRAHGLEKDVADKLRVTTEKPRAHLYIDDRGWRFEGTFPTLEEITTFQPWNRR